jgi:tagatose 1,6-diphosphate aldolase
MEINSIGKIRGLHQLADKNGRLVVCAIDHRESLQKALSHQKSGTIPYQEMVDFKLDLCRTISPYASSVLLDPLYSAAQAILSGVLPGRTGLLVSIEKTGYSGDSSARETEILPGWGVKKIKQIGASAVKLLVYFRADLEPVASKQLNLVGKIAEECIEEDIPLLVESVAYPTDQEKGTKGLFPKMKPELVIEAARKLGSLPIDILKSEFPGDLEYEKDEKKLASYCRRISEVSGKPWVLLSAGAEYDLFKREVEIACQNGASGFMAGRALWQEATALGSREARRAFFESCTVSRFKELAKIADETAVPWYDKYSFPRQELDENWYRSYNSAK